MEESDLKTYKTILVIVVIIAGIWIWSNQTEITKLQEKISEYQSTLVQANENIDNANSMIDEAKMAAWDNYNAMGEALDNLSNVEKVSEP